MNPYQSPADVLDVTSIKTDAPPRTVKWALIFLTVAFVIGFVKSIFSRVPKILGNSGEILSSCLSAVLVTGLMFLWLRGLYRGKKWAYVLFFLFAWMVLGTALMKAIRSLVFPPIWQTWIYLTQIGFQVGATIMLFLPVSWRWFYRRNPSGPVIMDEDG
ncbi:MAG: hypothetical protein ABIS50_20090 [Luteolibacter sp.]|uniref:hypothetical protein n=1 Tax=Luteolibacter sp. TaxID=1962973 RepID=UPI0032670FAF